MNFEMSNINNSAAQNSEQKLEKREVKVEIIEDDKTLREKMTFLKEAQKEINDTAPVSPEALSPDRAPKDIDLYNLSREERLKRREILTARYKEVLEKITPAGRLLETDERGALVEQPVTPDNLVFVRADDYIPEIGKNGELKISSAYDATGGKIWRLTNHFTLNHRVTSNSGGSWENKSYQFVIPGKKMVKANGLPENLYSIDTFWAKSVELPPGTVIVYERGKKPAIPKDREKDFILIERHKDVNDKELISLILERMNYSEIQGEAWSALPEYKIFDKGVKSFAAKEHLRSGPHVYSWSDAFEEIGWAKRDLELDQGFRFMIGLYGEGIDNEQARMPLELKEKAWGTLFDAFKIKEDQYKTLRQERESIDDYEPERFTDQAIMEKLETARNRLIGFVSDILAGGYDHGKYKIPAEDRATILRLVPKEAWQYEIDRMKNKIGDTLEGYKNLEEVKNVFREYFASPYHEITGRELNTEDLKF